MRWRVAIGVLIVSAVALAGLGWLWASVAGARGKVLRLPGVVEIQEVRLASKQGGRIKEIRVVEGQWVEQDQELMFFERPSSRPGWRSSRAQRDSIQVEIDKANTGSKLQEINAAAAAADAARAKWRRLEKGFRDEEIAQAESDYHALSADLTLYEEELSAPCRCSSAR